MNLSNLCPYQPQCLFYLQEELRESEKRELEQHLFECPLCQREIEDLRDCLELLQRPFPSLSRDLTSGILARIPPRRPLPVFLRPLSLALCSLALMVFTLSMVFYFYAPSTSVPQPSPLQGGPSLPQKVAFIPPKEWLRKNQEENGSWKVEKWGGQKEYTLAVTSLAMLALLKDEINPFEGPSQKALEKGLGYLLKSQNSQGTFGGASSYSLQTHILATLALNKARDWKGSSEISRSLHRALGYLKKVQQNPSFLEGAQYCQFLADSIQKEEKVETSYSKLWRRGKEWSNTGGQVFDQALSVLVEDEE